jgi:hypothetical protein
VDKLVTEVNGIASVTVNPKAEAIARIANIAGLDQLKVQEFVKAIDPVSMPLFLEAGSILFLMTAFAKRRKRLRQSIDFEPETLETATESVALGTASKKVFSKSDALRNFTAMRSSRAGPLELDS